MGRGQKAIASGPADNAKPFLCSRCKTKNASNTRDYYTCCGQKLIKRYLVVKLIRCTKCSFSTTINNLMDLHMEYDHGKGSLYCKQCGFSTAYKTVLDKHVHLKHREKARIMAHLKALSLKYQHLEEKPCKCDYCEFATRTDTALEEHERTLHGEPHERN